MSAQVTARSRRPLSFDMFAAMLPDAVVLTFVQAAGRQVTVTFNRDLTADEAQALAARLASTDDDDLADRAEMAELMATVAAMEPNSTRALLLAIVRRVLDA